MLTQNSLVAGGSAHVKLHYGPDQRERHHP